MPLSNVEYYVDTSEPQATFAVPFGYIEKDHVSVTVNNVDADYSWTTEGSIQLTTPAGKGDVVYIARTTPKDARLVDFTQSALLDEATLDKDSNQLFFVLQEVDDENKESMTQDYSGRWDAENRIITNLKDPVGSSDAVTRGWLQNSYESKYKTILSLVDDARAAERSARDSKNIAINAKDLTEDYKDLCVAYRDETKAYRDEVIQLEIDLDNAQATIYGYRDEALADMEPLVTETKGYHDETQILKDETLQIYNDTVALGGEASRWEVDTDEDLIVTNNSEGISRNIVPKYNGTSWEGSVGTSAKSWPNGYFGTLDVSLVKTTGLDVSGGIEASTLNASTELQIGGVEVGHYSTSTGVNLTTDRFYTQHLNLGDGDVTFQGSSIDFNIPVDFNQKQIIAPFLTESIHRGHSANWWINSGQLTIDAMLHDRLYKILDGNLTVKFSGESNIPSDKAREIYLYFEQDNTTAYTVTWPANIKWQGSSPPDLSVLGSKHFIKLTRLGSLLHWYGEYSSTSTTSDGGSTIWGSISGTLSDQLDLQNALEDKAPVTQALPDGGLTGQALIKTSDTDYDVQWSDVSGGTEDIAWGSITGTLSDQTDLQSALDAKSGTDHTHVEADITDLDKYTTTEIDGFLTDKADVSSLAVVATSGLRNDLTGDEDMAYSVLSKPALEGYVEIPGTPAIGYNTLTLDVSQNFFKHSLTENTTISMSNLDNIATGNVWSCTLVLTQADPAVTVTWPSNTRWSDATEPDLSGGGQTYVITLFTEDKGDSFYGFLAGKNMGVPT